MSDQGARLREARLAAGFDGPAAAAERFGWNVNTYKSNENGNATFSFKKAKEYAKAFGVRPEWLYDASGPAGLGEAPAAPFRHTEPGDPINLTDVLAFIAARKDNPPEKATGKLRPINRRIPVMGEVAAGLWRDAVPKQLEDAEEWLALDVAGYERAQLQAMRVVGTSMDLVYPPGRYVVIAHPAEAGLRHGDYVVVERSKADLVEITLKEFVVDEDGRVALWPRSSKKEFQTPIYLKDQDDLGQVGLKIIGVVVADYSKRERPPIAYEPVRG
jgi:SOS-response transcriptional repressor LexA